MRISAFFSLEGMALCHILSFKFLCMLDVIWYTIRKDNVWGREGRIMAFKPLPIGVDSFEDIIRNGYYYVDKTLMIKALWDMKGKVNLFTRPRRFGKTLNMSMLQYFFENMGSDELNGKNRELFAGLKIMEAGELYTGLMGQYPVISLSLKSGKQATFDLSMAMLKRRIAEEFRRHQQIRDQIGDQRERFDRIMMEKGDLNDYLDAIAFLSSLLKQCYGKPAIILIDEYDVPLENAYFNGFYEEMIHFIRSLFESALKTNSSLEFAVITGCLRITKESIFTGLNNLKVISILSEFYGEHFGFTQAEVDDMLAFYRREKSRETLKHWYDGYLFGGKEVYNPWSVINYVESLMGNEDAFPKPYWSNTSGNSIVKDLVENANIEVRGEIESLIDGGTIEKQIHEEITYGDIYQSEDNLWNFLFFTGYLKKVEGRMEGNRQYMTMAIPNEEVKYTYENTVLSWFDAKIRQKDFSSLFEALEQGDTDKVEVILVENLMETISFYDYAESYYHGFLAGILRSGGDKYLVKSNREAGLGRPDIVLRTPSVRGRAFVIEIKIADSLADMEHQCQLALDQIERQKYREELLSEGFKNIWTYGISFWKKEVMVRRGG